MKYPPNLRASWHEYNGGMYFVTFCTMDRMHYLGEIADGKMNFPPVVSWRAATLQGENRIAEYIENNVAEWDENKGIDY